MKSSLSVIFVVAIALALAGCGPEKVKGSAPNVVGQWEWSSPKGADWRLTISSDGKFRREMTDSANAKPTEIHGSWSSFEPREKEPSWIERHRLFQKSPEDELTRKAGYDPAKKKIEWSTPAMLSLHYSAPVPAPASTPAAGAASPAPKDARPAPPQDVVIGETELIRTYKDLDTGDVFLDLAGKTYKKVQGAATGQPGVATPSPVAATPPPPAAAVPPSSSALWSRNSASPWDASVAWWRALSGSESASAWAGTGSPEASSLFPAFALPEQVPSVVESPEASRAPGWVSTLPIQPCLSLSKATTTRKD